MEIIAGIVQVDKKHMRTILSFHSQHKVAYAGLYSEWVGGGGDAHLPLYVCVNLEIKGVHLEVERCSGRETMAMDNLQNTFVERALHCSDTRCDDV